MSPDPLFKKKKKTAVGLHFIRTTTSNMTLCFRHSIVHREEL